LNAGNADVLVGEDVGVPSVHLFYLWRQFLLCVLDVRAGRLLLFAGYSG